MNILNILGTTSAIYNGRQTIGSAISANDKAKILRAIKVVDNGSIAAAIIMFGICLICALAPAVYATISIKEVQREKPVIPIEIGAEPRERIVDTTGFMGEYAIDSVTRNLASIGRYYNIQIMLYNSEEPARDLYHDYFDDENGVLVYLEEHEGSGSLHFYCGSNLRNIFTPESIAYLIDEQTYLNQFTHDRAQNVAMELYYSLGRLFEGSRDMDDVVFTYGASVFWILMGIVAIKIMPLVVRVSLGVPGKKREYKRFKEWAYNL